MAALDDGSDAALEGWVPSLDHATFADWDRVYEPSEDTFLLLDALFAERASLRALAPRSVVEIGPGSGAVSAYVARLLAPARPWQVCVELNPDACDLCARTAAANGADRVDVVRGDLGACLRPGSVDVLIFNPPYVPTPRDEVGGDGIEASWAGGDRGASVSSRASPGFPPWTSARVPPVVPSAGREVLDRLLPHVHEYLAPRGRFYLVVVAENDPDDVARILAADGLRRTTVAAKRARNELLSILRFSRDPA